MRAEIWGVMLLATIVIGTLAFRLWRYRKQIEHIITEIMTLNGEDTNHRVSSFCRVGKTGELIDQINVLNDRHKEAQRTLKRENRIYKESIIGISHDIRTPLTSAKGYVQMLGKGELSQEKRHEYTNRVERRLNDLTDMLDRLFEYARIEAGELSFEPERFNAVSAFADVVSGFYDEFAKKGCEPMVQIPDAPCFVMVDRQAFSRVIENLIKNALVHGTGEYRISLARDEKWLRILVANQTNSIEPSDIERIFDRFYTTDQSGSRKTTGLGLAIVKRFVEQMGGSAEATLDGTYFTIRVKVPLLPANAD